MGRTLLACFLVSASLNGFKPIFVKLQFVCNQARSQKPSSFSTCVQHVLLCTVGVLVQVQVGKPPPSASEPTDLLSISSRNPHWQASSVWFLVGNGGMDPYDSP